MHLSLVTAIVFVCLQLLIVCVIIVWVAVFCLSSCRVLFHHKRSRHSMDQPVFYLERCNDLWKDVILASIVAVFTTTITIVALVIIVVSLLPNKPPIISKIYYFIAGQTHTQDWIVTSLVGTRIITVHRHFGSYLSIISLQDIRWVNR